MIIKKRFNQWIYNEQEIIKILKKTGKECNNNAIVEYLLESAINDKKFRKDVLEKMSEYGELHSFYIHGKYVIKNKLFRKINNILNMLLRWDSTTIIIDSTRLIEYLNKKKELNKIEISFLEKLMEYSNSSDIVEKVLDREIKNNLTYRDLIYFFMKTSDEFDKGIVDDKILGLTLKRAHALLYNEPIKYSLTSFIDKMNVSDSMKENFRVNTKKVLYLIIKKEENDKTTETEKNFRPNYELTNKFELNSDLKYKIMSKVPEHFSDLQKAYCIYRFLCQEFIYDEEYFYLKYCVPNKDHTSFLRLSKLKGGEEIICTGFSLVYAKFLELLGLPFTTLDYGDNLVTNLSTRHIKIRFKVDNYIIDADGATDLYKGDMVTQKTLNKVENFRVISGNRYDKNFKKQIQEVDEYFESISSSNEFDQAVDIYRQIYFNRNKEYSKLTFLERIDLIEKIIIESRLKFFDLIEMCSMLRKIIMFDWLDKIKIEFIVRKKDDSKEGTRIKNNLCILIAYNEFSNLDTDYNSNRYIVITPDRKIEEVTYKTLKERFDGFIYDFTNNDRIILGLKEMNVSDRKNNSGRTVK